MGKKKLIYVCSPFRNDRQGNTQKAIEHARLVCSKGGVPIVPHLYFTQFLEDSNPDERKEGMKLGGEILKHCDEMWVFGVYPPTEGMWQEIIWAVQHGITIKFVR